jgi:hypothetical protein
VVPGRDDTGPSWLPDGKRFLVRTTPPPNDPTGFFLNSLAGGPLERVYTGEGWYPQWQNGDGGDPAAGAGDTILYVEKGRIMTTRPGGAPHVVVAEAALSRTAQIGFATWSHDNLRVIFSVHTEDYRVVSPDQQTVLPEEQQPDWELWSVALDGTGLRNLSNDPALRQVEPGT